MTSGCSPLPLEMKHKIYDMTGSWREAGKGGDSLFLTEVGLSGSSSKAEIILIRKDLLLNSL